MICEHQWEGCQMENQPAEPQKTEKTEILDKEEKPQVSVTSSYVQIRQAPLPTPEELKAYKAIEKTLPDRIVSMAEKEQSFRHRSTYLGQGSFILLVGIGYGLAAFSGIMGAELTGTAIAAGVSYIVYVFKTKKPEPPKVTQNHNGGSRVTPE